MLNNRLEILEKENFDLKQEIKNLKKLCSGSSNQQMNKEFQELKFENQKLRHALEGAKGDTASEPREPSLMLNQDSINQESFN